MAKLKELAASDEDLTTDIEAMEDMLETPRILQGPSSRRQLNVNAPKGE